MRAKTTQLDLATLPGMPQGPDAQPEIHAECVRVGQRPHAEGRFAIGLLPADERVGVTALALHMGWALARLSRRRVGLVDANVRYPAFPLERRRRPASLEAVTKPPLGMLEGAETGPDTERGQRARAAASVFAEREIDEWLTLLSPRGVGEAGAGVPQLELLVQQYREAFAHLVVDLTGFQRLGDHLNAIALIDGVVVVARARCSRERDLLRLRDELPSEANLGVILLA
jgi:hypothetical protein